MNRDRIAIFIPTPIEAAPLMRRGAKVNICGMGLMCHGCLEGFLRKDRPELAILAGTAGAYDGSFAVGDCVVVRTEWNERGESVCSAPDAGLDSLFPFADSMTVERVGAAPEPSALIENMEGYHFMQICNRLAIPCVELRVISNRVAAPRSEWFIEESSERLPDAIEKIIDFYTK